MWSIFYQYWREIKGPAHLVKHTLETPVEGSLIRLALLPKRRIGEDTPQFFFRKKTGNRDKDRLRGLLKSQEDGELERLSINVDHLLEDYPAYPLALAFCTLAFSCFIACQAAYFTCAVLLPFISV